MQKRPEQSNIAASEFKAAQTPEIVKSAETISRILGESSLEDLSDEQLLNLTANLDKAAELADQKVLEALIPRIKHYLEEELRVKVLEIKDKKSPFAPYRVEYTLWLEFDVDSNPPDQPIGTNIANKMIVYASKVNEKFPGLQITTHRDDINIKLARQ